MSSRISVPETCVALVIDDNPFARRLLTTMLKQIGFAKVLQAENGVAGTELALKHSPDLILLDWAMPGKDGADVLCLLTACDHDFARSPVMVTSTVATRDAIVRAARLGAAGFIVQPFARSTLASRIARIMADAGAQEARLSA